MIWGRCDLGEARGPPAVRIHCCWTEPLRALDALIGVCIARPVGAACALARCRGAAGLPTGVGRVLRVGRSGLLWVAPDGCGGGSVTPGHGLSGQSAGPA